MKLYQLLILAVAAGALWVFPLIYVFVNFVK